MQLLLFSFLLSWAVTYLIIRYGHLHASYTRDSANGVQKYHNHPVLRIGGMGILCALFSSDCQEIGDLQAAASG